jgi:hypothetical protein
MNSGICYVSALGASTSTQLAAVDSRVVNLANGRLYVSTSQGVNTVGQGTPTTPNQSVNLLVGFSDPTIDPYGFYFADPTTLYVADARTDGNGGIRKYLFDGVAWTYAYTLAPNSGTGFTGLQGCNSQQLYATTSQGSSSGSQCILITDNGEVGSTFAVIATAQPNTAFVGLALMPTPAVVIKAETLCAHDAVLWQAQDEVTWYATDATVWIASDKTLWTSIDATAWTAQDVIAWLARDSVGWQADKGKSCPR